MKIQISKQQIKKGTAKAVSFIAGEAHMHLKSAADITAHLESLAVHRLIGKAKTAVKEDRYNRTEEKQEEFLDNCRKIRDMINGEFEDIEPEVYNENRGA